MNPVLRMNHVDWTSPRCGRVTYTYAQFAAAKSWFFAKWSDWASDRGLGAPPDLSGSCKYASLYMQSIFGGAIRGHFEHQYNFIDGRLVDLSHDALDVGRMLRPYLHEPEYFSVPELQAALVSCQPRAERWAHEFIEHSEAAQADARTRVDAGAVRPTGP